MFHRILADLVLGVHAAFVLFVIGGLVAVLVGGWQRWRWVRGLWFRLAHLAAIAVVVLQTWLGVICPLTTWEMRLREQAGEATYRGGFVAHWVHKLLFFDAPWWVFVVAYTAFAAAVVASWFLVPPRRSGAGRATRRAG